MPAMTHEEKLLFIENINKIVNETENPPVSKHVLVIGNACAQLEAMLKNPEYVELKTELAEALKTVEQRYKAHLDSIINRPWIAYVELDWYANEINQVVKSLDYLKSNAPTQTTKLLYMDYVKQYVAFLQETQNKKTPGHPACIAAHAALVRETIAAAEETTLLATSNAPLFFALPKDPNGAANAPAEILVMHPRPESGAASSVADDDSEQDDDLDQDDEAVREPSPAPM